MISEQTATHTATRASHVRALSDTSVAVEVTGTRSTGWPKRLRALADRAGAVAMTVFGARRTG
jgi:hypothetical protein